MPSSLAVNGLSFSWPDATLLFSDLHLTVAPGRTGLIGRNGSGKSTLLELIAGVRQPSGGTITVSGSLGYLPQHVTLDVGTTVEQALGIAEARAALQRIEAGETDPWLYDAVGDDWDVDTRAAAWLERLGLGHVALDRLTGTLSGGEVVLLRLAAELLREPDVLLLDEPTNNLDRRARERLYAAVDGWRGSLLLVSHDRELLERVDRIADLRPEGVRVFGGTLTEYLAVLDDEQQAAQRMVRVAEGDVKRESRDLIDSRTRQARRDRQGRKAGASGMPRIVAGAKKRAAQVTAGRLNDVHERKLAQARAQLEKAEAAVRDDDRIRVDLPDTAIPSQRIALQLRGLTVPTGSTVDLELRGPERIALVGANGSGKTTLLRTIAGLLEPAEGSVHVRVPMRYLPQRLDILVDDLSVVENVARFAPDAEENVVRAALARFLFIQREADQPVATLSGGERFRATLAALLLAQPAPQLLLLDEPTNNLDLDSVARLSEALSEYKGALLVASHDEPFLDELGLTARLELPEGRLVRS